MPARFDLTKWSKKTDQRRRLLQKWQTARACWATYCAIPRAPDGAISPDADAIGSSRQECVMEQNRFSPDTTIVTREFGSPSTLPV